MYSDVIRTFLPKPFVNDAGSTVICMQSEVAYNTGNSDFLSFNGSLTILDNSIYCTKMQFSFPKSNQDIIDTANLWVYYI